MEPARSTSQRARSTQQRDAKRVAREQRLRRQRQRTWLRIGLVTGIAAAVVAGIVALYASDTFAITSIEVEGVSHLAQAEVVEAAALPPGSTLLRYPKEEMETRLKGDPWISEARISRRFLHTIVIHVDERKPAAAVDVGETQFWLVDSEGMVLGQLTPKENAEIPIVVRDLTDFTPVAGEQSRSASLTNALAIIAGLSDTLSAEVRSISAPSVDLTTLITASDVEILVGSAEDIGKKDAVARQIMAEEGEKVVHINVRTVDRPTWRGLDSTQ